MKTNTLILSAATFAVGALSCATAQNVYSVNVVGYVNVPIPHGLTILGNPLSATDNSVNGLFLNESTNNGANSSALGLTVYTWSGTGFIGDHNDTYGGGWNNPALPLNPGTGFFVANPGSAFTNTFIGNVVQFSPIQLPPLNGFTNFLNPGLNLVASAWPDATNLVQLGLNAGLGDTVYLWSGTGFWGYHLDTYGAGWSSLPPPAPQSGTGGPTIDVGEGFF
jgi:hypothetical protein